LEWFSTGELERRFAQFRQAEDQPSGWRIVELNLRATIAGRVAKEAVSLLTEEERDIYIKDVSAVGRDW